LPVIAPLGPLEEESLIRVLTEPKNALVRQYQQLFAMENAELHFTDEALRAVAHKAIKKQTGARGLRSIIEGMMLEIMFDLPDHGNGQRYVITEDVVEGRAKLFPLQDTKNKSA
jgi:ATP-dependent Clp protease ATP-binding subunit ClpX